MLQRHHRPNNRSQRFDHCRGQLNIDDGYARAPFYDSLSRPTLTTTTLNGTETYTSGNAYDTFGRLQSVTFATGAISAEVGYSYNGNGFLSKIVSGNGVHWQGNTQDALNRVTSESLGNGLIVNRGYDANTARLRTISAGPGGTASVQADTYDYDHIGNVLSRAQLTATSGPTFTETFAYDNLCSENAAIQVILPLLGEALRSEFKLVCGV